MSELTNEAGTKFVHINDITDCHKFCTGSLVSLFTRVFVQYPSVDNQPENFVVT